MEGLEGFVTENEEGEVEQGNTNLEVLLLLRKVSDTAKAVLDERYITDGLGYSFGKWAHKVMDRLLEENIEIEKDTLFKVMNAIKFSVASKPFKWHGAEGEQKVYWKSMLSDTAYWYMKNGDKYKQL